jgi:selenocysteine lyase/cysteine desulfurase
MYHIGFGGDVAAREIGNHPADEPWEDLRRAFPGLEDCVFLDAACVSLAPAPSIAAVEGFLRKVVQCDERDASEHHVALDRLRRPAVLECAALIGADESEVALVESTTQGLNIAAQAIPFAASDNVVLADLEFLQVAIPWVKLKERGDIADVRLARNVGGTVPVEAFARVVDSNTRAIVVSSVQWTNGYRVDLDGLGRLCREVGAYLVVDAIQGLGALEMDVSATPVDFLVAGGHKWLNSPFGCGLLYLNRQTTSQLSPAAFGYLALAEPEGGWPRYFATPEITPLRRYDFPRRASSFEVGGTANYPGAMALGAAVALLNRIGTTQIEDRVLALAESVANGLDELGLHVVTHREREVRSGITTFTVSSRLEENEALVARLLDQRVLVSLRYTSGVGGIRVSTHAYNTEADVGAFLEAVKRSLPLP